MVSVICKDEESRSESCVRIRTVGKLWEALSGLIGGYVGEGGAMLTSGEKRRRVHVHWRSRTSATSCDTHKLDTRAVFDSPSLVHILLSDDNCYFTSRLTHG